MRSEQADRPNHQLVLQRVHNRLLEYLELASSLEEQREYQRKAPVNVANEMIEQWADWYDELRAPRFVSPAFSDAERDAMAEFHRVWDAVCESTPSPLPDLETTIRMPEWTRLREAAARALAVFRVRGPLPENEDIDSA